MEATPPDWLPSLDKCPADVMPAQETKSGYFKGRCENILERCVQNCRAGDAPDCYAAAQILLRVKKDSSVPQALFLRACAMGVASGCTNRAASMDLEGGSHSACAIRTFTVACESGDPWACTTIGLHLIRGTGIAKDLNHARQVLSRSCLRYGDTDEACRAAKRLLKEIGE